MKQISLVITYHKKTLWQVKRLLDSLNFLNKDDVEVIFIYREISEEVLDLINDEIYIDLIDKKIKINEGRKNKKIILAAEQSDAKYIQVVDPDDFIFAGQLNRLAKKIKEEKLNVDFILNTYFQDFDIIKGTKKITPKNHSSIISKDTIKNISNIRDNTISQDLHFCAMAFYNSETFTSVNVPFYTYFFSEIDENNASHLKNVVTKVGYEEYKENYKDIYLAIKNYKYDNLNSKIPHTTPISKLFKRRIKMLEKELGIKK